MHKPTMKQQDIGLYGILTNPVIGYEALARIMVEQGLKYIQLRMKNVPETTVLDTAHRIRSIVPSDVHFIVNDSIDIALEVKADGVHLGQGDEPYNLAREKMGPDAIIGLSTHNPSQTATACALGPDYIGIGPVYATPTKQIADPVIGIGGMQKMLQIATVPAVCLGGVDHSNIDTVLEGGARGICAVRCINQSNTPADDIKKLLQTVNRYLS